MAVITVGDSATSRSTYFSEGYTGITLNKSADGTGTINSVSFYFYTDAGSVYAGLFYLSSGTTYINRSQISIGNCSSGSKQTFTGVSGAVVLGDFIGFYFNPGWIYIDGGGSALYKLGNNMGTTSTYSAGTWFISCEGSGITPGKKWNGITISKWNGALLSKINII